jgi:hypothetical protein
MVYLPKKTASSTPTPKPTASPSSRVSGVCMRRYAWQKTQNHAHRRLGYHHHQPSSAGLNAWELSIQPFSNAIILVMCKAIFRNELSLLNFTYHTKRSTSNESTSERILAARSYVCKRGKPQGRFQHRNWGWKKILKQGLKTTCLLDLDPEEKQFSYMRKDPRQE